MVHSHKRHSNSDEWKCQQHEQVCLHVRHPEMLAEQLCLTLTLGSVVSFQWRIKPTGAGGDRPLSSSAPRTRPRGPNGGTDARHTSAQMQMDRVNTGGHSPQDRLGARSFSDVETSDWSEKQQLTGGGAAAVLLTGPVMRFPWVHAEPQHRKKGSGATYAVFWVFCQERCSLL